MKSLLEFFKSCLIGGLFVVLPLALFYMLLSQILQLLVAIATPIADLLPAGMFDEVKAPVVIAIILIVGARDLLAKTMLPKMIKNEKNNHSHHRNCRYIKGIPLNGLTGRHFADRCRVFNSGLKID